MKSVLFVEEHTIPEVSSFFLTIFSQSYNVVVEFKKYLNCVSLTSTFYLE